METSRRALLGSSLAGGALLVAGCSGEAGPATQPTPTGSPDPRATPTFDPSDWESVRAQFRLDPEVAPFAAYVLSPHPAPVAAAISRLRDALDTDTERALLDGLALEDGARVAAGAYTGSDATHIALTSSTTEGIALMYGGLTLAEGDEVLSTTHDFWSTEESLRLLAERTGARVRRTSMYDEPETATVDEMVSRLVDAVTPRTRVVGITWVHSSTGVRTPVREIADALKGQDVLLCVDGVHGFGAVDVDVADLGCDFLATGTHKWLFGPRGTGILWARDWSPLHALVPSFSGQADGMRLSPGGYQAFEHRWALPDAFAMHEQIGRTAVVGRTVEQASQLKEGLAGIDGITVKTPADPAVSAGIVCVDVRGQRPPEAVHRLHELGIGTSATPYAVSYLRLGPSIATTPEQVDAAIEAVGTIV